MARQFQTQYGQSQSQTQSQTAPRSDQDQNLPGDPGASAPTSRLAANLTTWIRMLSADTGPERQTPDEALARLRIPLNEPSNRLAVPSARSKPRAVGDHASLRCDAGEGLKPPASRFNELDATTSDAVAYRSWFSRCCN